MGETELEDGGNDKSAAADGQQDAGQAGEKQAGNGQDADGEKLELTLMGGAHLVSVAEIV